MDNYKDLDIIKRDASKKFVNGTIVIPKRTQTDLNGKTIDGRVSLT